MLSQLDLQSGWSHTELQHIREKYLKRAHAGGDSLCHPGVLPRFPVAVSPSAEADNLWPGALIPPSDSCAGDSYDALDH